MHAADSFEPVLLFTANWLPRGDRLHVRCLLPTAETIREKLSRYVSRLEYWINWTSEVAPLLAQEAISWNFGSPFPCPTLKLVQSTEFKKKHTVCVCVCACVSVREREEWLGQMNSVTTAVSLHYFWSTSDKSLAKRKQVMGKSVTRSTCRFWIHKIVNPHEVNKMTWCLNYTRPFRESEPHQWRFRLHLVRNVRHQHESVGVQLVAN